MRGDRLTDFSIRNLLILIACLCFAGAAIAQQEPPGEPAAEPSLNAAQGRALLQAVRHVMTPIPSLADPGALDPELLDAPNECLLILSLYESGPALFVGGYEGRTLNEAARAAGRDISEQIRELPDGERTLRQARLQVDLVTKRDAMHVRNRLFASEKIQFGMDGIICYLPDRRVYFTPLAVLRHARDLDFIKSAFIAQESTVPPANMKMERIRTEAFVESGPGGAALHVFHGNTLIEQPYAGEMTEAAFLGGLWLLRMQQEDGSFLPAWFPAAERVDADAEYNLLDHTRAMLTLVQLYQLTEDERYLDAFKRARDYLLPYVEQNRRLRLAYLKSRERDEISATALLLTTLCSYHMIQQEGTASASAFELQLGEFLCTLIDEDGWLHTRLANVIENKEVRISQGPPYAEVLMGLCMLEGIAPRERVRKKIGDLIELMTSFRSAAPPAGPRTIEAIAQTYALTRDPELAEAAVALGNMIVELQVNRDELPAPDYLGAFSEPNLAPQTFTAAQAMSGMARAYQMARIRKEPGRQFSEPVRDAAQFLITMQFRPDNVYYLRHPEVLLGGFRKGVEDLTLQAGPTAESVRALLSAAAVTAETIAPEEVE